MTNSSCGSSSSNRIFPLLTSSVPCQSTLSTLGLSQGEFFFLFLIGAYPFVSLGPESKNQPENNAVASSSRSTPIDSINDTTNLSASNGFIFPNDSSQQQQQEQSRTRTYSGPWNPYPFFCVVWIGKWKWGEGSMIIRDNKLQAVTFGGTPGG